jgi:hypothetical protein
MPGPWRSKLTKYQNKIAEERSKIPPTPYVEIARILNEEYKLGITAGSIWAFVKARDPRRAKKVFKLPDQAATAPIQPPPSQPPGQGNAKKERPIYEPEPEPKHDPYAP